MPVRNAPILFVALLALAWTPSPAYAMSGQQTVAAPQPASPKPNPDSTGKYHLGDGVTPPKLLFAPDPEFTAEARHKRVQGVTVVSLTVDVAGNPQDVRVARSMSEDVSEKYKPIAKGLDDKAVEAVKQYKFEAGQFQGKPVPVGIEVKVNFRIW
jgi:TonB family protein